jgi:hypothetical protein
MDCTTAKEWMAIRVAGEVEATETLRAHLSKCPNCQAEYEASSRTWSLLGTWSDTEPPARLDRTILAEVRAATETTRSWLGWLASGRVWATGGAAAVLAIVVSLVVPYQDSLRLCGRLFADAGFAIPAPLLSFLVGLPYAFIPLLAVALTWMCVKAKGRELQGFMVGRAFAVLMVPYILFACADLEATAIVGILLGTVAGALLGGGASQWVIRHRPRGVTA